MSSKIKNTFPKEEAKHALVPKLRFPEFRGDEEWKAKTLGEVTIKTDKRNKGGKSYPVYSISNKTGFTPQSEQFEGVDSEKRGYDLALYKLIESNTFAYNPARINVGSIGYSGDLNNVIISSLYVCFKAKPDAADQFLQHFFGTNDFDKSVNNHVEGGIRSYLFYENFARIPIPLPSLPEQQRIAECLSSVDELIAAQARKVDALKTHKKGLMQQLFPREGETQPRRRFPEFQDTGDWEAKPFEEFVTKSFYGTSSSTSPIGKYPVLRMGNMVDGGLDFTNLVYLDLDSDSFESFRLEDGDILLNRTNSPALVGKISLFQLKSDYLTASYIVTYRLNKRRMVPAFCNSMLNTPLYQSRIKSFARPSVSQANINPTIFKKELIVTVPSLPEQQRIATCLSSLDTQITVETRKLEALKTHKKGLMQKLFPSSEEIEA